MEFDAEFFVLLGFLVFVGVLVYFGAHRIVLKALDARGEAIAAELAQAAKLREEATALLASFEKKTAEAEAERRRYRRGGARPSGAVGRRGRRTVERVRRPAHQASRGQDRSR